MTEQSNEETTEATNDSGVPDENAKEGGTPDEGASTGDRTTMDVRASEVDITPDPQGEAGAVTPAEAAAIEPPEPEPANTDGDVGAAATLPAGTSQPNDPLAAETGEVTAVDVAAPGADPDDMTALEVLDAADSTPPLE